MTMARRDNHSSGGDFIPTGDMLISLVGTLMHSMILIMNVARSFKILPCAR